RAGRFSFAPDTPWSTNSVAVQPRAAVNARSTTSWFSGFWSVVLTRAYSAARRTVAFAIARVTSVSSSLSGEELLARHHRAIRRSGSGVEWASGWGARSGVGASA